MATTNATIPKRESDKPVVKSVDALRALWSSAIRTHVSAEIALLLIMKACDFVIYSLQDIWEEDNIDISFSNVHYEDIAPFIGISYFGMDDVVRMFKTFNLSRSRIPTAVFKSIVEDLDVTMVQYGPIRQQTLWATSQFLSPIFNHLIALFGFAFRNVSEPVIKDCFPTKNSVQHYFRMVGPIPVLFMEFSFHGSYTRRSDAIAQVIAECIACDWYNTQRDSRVPIYCIIFDGNSHTYEFFLFDGTTDPYSFKYGLKPNHRQANSWDFQLPDPVNLPTTHHYIDSLRTICEVIFDLLLNAYVSSLKAYRDTEKRSTIAYHQKHNFDRWEEAISTAVKASEGFRDAEAKRQSQLTDAANSLVEEAMVSLKHSVDALEGVPIIYRPNPIMSSWDDEEVEKV